MRRKTAVAVLFVVGLAALAILLLGGQAQGAKPAANVQLRASFQEFTSTESGLSARILNDANGSYATNSRQGVSVYLTGDNGELVFTVDHHSARRVRVIFPLFVTDLSDDYGWLPDTEGIYRDQGLPYEPIDFFKFRTFNSIGFAEPKVNFLKMDPDVETRVRLWTTFCTTLRHYFFMNYSADIGVISGVVEVVAHGPKGALTSWELHPVPGTGDSAKIYKHPETGDDSVNHFFTESPMPFKLTLERITR